MPIPDGELVLTGISTANLRRDWPGVEPWLTKACSENSGRMSPLDYYKAIEARDMQLWVVTDGVEIYAVVVTQITKYPGKTALGVDICVGREMPRWAHLIETLESYARAQGCEALMLYARPGWERVMTDYRKTHVILEKDL